ncbi:hypothetical protein V8C86DRAFT_2454093 [Haematococcus lacustris]
MHQRGNLLLAAPTSFEKVKETFMPFWMVRLEVLATASQAQVGQQVAVTRSNPQTGRSEVVWETQWRVVRANYQVYASHKYLRVDLEALRPGPLLAHLQPQPLTAEGMLDGPRGALRRVMPFSMDPADARSYALAAVRRREREAAEAWFKQLASGGVGRADQVQAVDLEVRVLLHCTSPLYVPVYVFSRKALRAGWAAGLDQLLALALGGAGQPPKLHTFVSGVEGGRVAGAQLYDEAKAAAVAAVAGPLVLLLSGWAARLTLPALLLSGLMIPVLLAVAIARYLPELRHASHAAAQRLRAPRTGPSLLAGLRRWLGGGQAAGAAEPDSSSREGTRSWDEDEWVAAFEELEAAQRRAETERQRQQQYQYQHQHRAGGSSRGGTGGGSRGDSRGGGQQSGSRAQADPYQVLGVGRDASVTDIQAAFRALALRHHPDRFAEPDKKAAATRTFQRISEAYSTLRDARKRAAYDQGRA